MKKSTYTRVTVALLAGIAFCFAAGSVSATTPNPVPHLDPVVPSAAAPGGPAFTMTVTGTGFVSGSAVYWNGAVRTTTFVSSSKLTAAIAAADIATPSTATITVVSPAPGGGTSNFQFFQVVTPAAQQFWTVKDVTGSIPLTSPIASGDFNNDGKLDLTAAIGPTVWVSISNGDGTFQPGIPSSGPAGTITMINVADVNGDGKLDLIVSGSKNSTTYFVATMLGNGNGTFQAPIETDFAGRIPQGVLLADFNGDGVLDLAFTSGMGIQTLLGNGDGTFREGPVTTLNQIPLNVVATGDFNKDGKADLVATVYDLFSTGFDFVVMLPGNGDGSFGAEEMVNGSGSSFVGAITAAVGDFNGDGNLDVATAIQTTGATTQAFVQIALGNGDGTFQPTSNVPNVTSVTTPLLVADVNGDGNLDLGTGGYTFYGQGDGTFPTFQGTANNPNTYVLVGDFNGDGKIDVVDESITLNGSSVLTAVQVTLQAPPAPDFTGIIAPYNSVLVAGGNGTSIAATIHPLYGFTGDVVVGATDLPPGVTPSYNPVVVKGASGSTTITLTAASTTSLGNYNVTLTGNSGSITHTATVPITVAASESDWTGTIVNEVQNIAPGGTATYTATVSPLNGVASGNVTPSVSGLPAGATATFNPPVIPESGGTTTLTIQTANTTPQPQVYNLTLTGTDGVFVHSNNLYLGVSSSGGDFTGSITPAQATTSAGGAVTYNVNISPVNGGAGDITFTVSGVPGGAIGTFHPDVIPASSGSGTLTVNTSAGTVPGTYPLTVTSTGSGVIHLTFLTLVVTP